MGDTPVPVIFKYQWGDTLLGMDVSFGVLPSTTAGTSEVTMVMNANLRGKLHVYG